MKTKAIQAATLVENNMGSEVEVTSCINAKEIACFR